MVYSDMMDEKDVLKSRWIWIIAILAILTLLCAYSAHSYPPLSLNTCLDNPEAYDGQVVTWYNEPMIGGLYNDGFELLQGQGASIRVYADTTGLIPGKFIGMRAVYYKEGFLKSQSLVMATHRRYKIWLSVIPVLFIAFLFFRSFRFNLPTLTVEERPHA